MKLGSLLRTTATRSGRSGTVSNSGDAETTSSVLIVRLPRLAHRVDVLLERRLVGEPVGFDRPRDSGVGEEVPVSQVLVEVVNAHVFLFGSYE